MGGQPRGRQEPGHDRLAIRQHAGEEGLLCGVAVVAVHLRPLAEDPLDQRQLVEPARAVARERRIPTELEPAQGAAGQEIAAGGDHAIADQRLHEHRRADPVEPGRQLTEEPGAGRGAQQRAAARALPAAGSSSRWRSMTSVRTSSRCRTRIDSAPRSCRRRRFRRRFFNHLRGRGHAQRGQARVLLGDVAQRDRLHRGPATARAQRLMHAHRPGARA